MRTIGELEERGCGAAGYRLSGVVVEHVCCRHLYGQDRMLIVWEPKAEPLLWIADAICGVMKEYLLGEDTAPYERLRDGGVLGDPLYRRLP